jgi:hypothetical protein
MINNQINVCLTNENITDFTGAIEYVFLDLSNGQILSKERKNISIKGGERIKDESIPLANVPKSGTWIMIATLYTERDFIVNRNYYSSKKWKHLKTSPADLTINKSGENKITLVANSLSLFTDCYHAEANFSDRGFILLTGEKRELEIIASDVCKVDVEDIKIFTLNDYLSL